MLRTVCLIGMLAGLLACGNPTSPEVSLSQGVLTGISKEGISLYRGIPYAEPPLGDLRWAAPQAHKGWSGTLHAEAFGPACWQTQGTGNDLFLAKLTEGAGMGGFMQWALSTMSGMFLPDISEDCLTLNVATPEQRSEPLPVLFWIHGGGHQFGSGGGPYESITLTQQGVVLVSINYRLGLYGFFAHPELAAEDPDGSTGNYGMQDQILALQWVRDNIREFGGDPDNVTIFGESAGGHSVGQLMASDLAKGLFHRAIAQSGTGFYQFQAVDKNHERLSGFEAGTKAAEKLGLSAAAAITQMRSMSTEELATLAQDEEISATFHPQIDGHVLKQATAQTFLEGKQAAIPLIVGSNADEGSVLYYLGLSPIDGHDAEHPQPQTTQEWDSLLDQAFANQGQALAQHYQVDTNHDVVKAAEILMGDTWFGRHAYYMATAHAEAGHPSYLYFYERHPPSEHQTIGASHALELNHIFDGLIPGWPTDARDDELRAEMQQMWVSFAQTGNPNATQTEWATFNPVAPTEMVFGHERTYTRPPARQARYELMKDQFMQRVSHAAGPSMTQGGH